MAFTFNIVEEEFKEFEDAKDSKEKPKPNLAFPNTDGALEVENQILYVSKSRLCNASPVFKSMFESDFKEKDMEAIKLPGKKVEDVELFLDSIYRSNKNVITEKTVLQILPLAHEYMAKDILSKCEETMLKYCNENMKRMKPDIQNAFLDQLLSFLSVLEKYSLRKDVFRTLVGLASLIEFSVIEKTEGFRCLSDDAKVLVMSKRLEGFERIYRNPPSVFLQNKRKKADVSAFDSLFKFKKQGV